jgi:hypothetical protein
LSSAFQKIALVHQWVSLPEATAAAAAAAVAAATAVGGSTGGGGNSASVQSCQVSAAFLDKLLVTMRPWTKLRARCNEQFMQKVLFVNLCIWEQVK